MRRDIFFYFKKSIVFFDLKAKAIPPAVFIVILAMYALYFYLMQIDYQAVNLMSLQNLSPESTPPAQTSFSSFLVSIVIMLCINLVSFIYLDAAIREAKNEEYAAMDCVNSALKYFLRLSAVTILKNIILLAGLFLFVVPGIYIGLMLLFAECAILHRDRKVVASLQFSRNITKGRRGYIFKVELFCNLILLFFIILILNIFATNNLIVFQYIFLFMLSMFTLINHKLTAYLYVETLAAHEGAGCASGASGGISGGMPDSSDRTGSDGISDSDGISGSITDKSGDDYKSGSIPDSYGDDDKSGDITDNSGSDGMSGSITDRSGSDGMSGNTPDSSGDDDRTS